uniref:hypothetical protein n=1 Tax=Peribacillus psychrosaccharolyticus TaxID=1407 RepID=UPI001F2CA5E0
MKLILNFNKLKILILIFLVNIYLLLYIAKIYEFSFVNDNVRFIIMLLLSFVIAISMFKMIAVNKKINLAFAVFLSLLFYVLIVTLMREQFNPTPLMSTLFFPIVFLASYAIFKKSKNLSIIKKYQFIMLILYGAMYLYVRLITNTNHGMVLNSIYYQVLL